MKPKRNLPSLTRLLLLLAGACIVAAASGKHSSLFTPGTGLRSSLQSPDQQRRSSQGPARVTPAFMMAPPSVCSRRSLITPSTVSISKADTVSPNACVSSVLEKPLPTVLTPMLSLNTSVSRGSYSLAGHHNASIEVSTVQECRITHVTMQSMPVQAASTFSPQMFLITYHSKAGKPCSASKIASNITACFAIVRQLHVRHMTRQDRTSVFTASFVPDSSTRHFIIAVQTADDPAGCVVLPVLAQNQFEPEQEIINGDLPNLCYGAGLACRPLLHRKLPAMHDFAIDIRADEGLTVSYPQSHHPPASNVPERRLCDGCALTASYGINRFVVTYPALLLKLYPDHVTNATVYGRLINGGRIININPSMHHDNKLRGYLVEFDLRDPGQYTLEVGISWYFGLTEPGALPLPIPVSGLMADNYESADFLRSLIHGRQFVSVTLNEPAVETPERPRWGNAKCTHGDNEGRWMNLRDAPCYPPLCTGDIKANVNNVDWCSYIVLSWVWVPYDCYYHIYSKEDLYTCAAETNVSWIHMFGDSQEREFVSRLKVMNGSQTSMTRYEKCKFEMAGSPNNLTVSYSFYEQMGRWSQTEYTDIRNFTRDDLPYLDTYNVVPRPSAGYVDFGLSPELKRPSVFVINNANAYTGKHQAMENHNLWLADFKAYLGNNGSAFRHPTPVPDRPLAFTPSTLIWMVAPQTVSKARNGNLYVTTARTTLASLASKAVMKELGFPIVDTRIMTQSRWDATIDGIHYAASGAYSDDWLGAVSAMFSQVILNTMFPTCTGATET